MGGPLGLKRTSIYLWVRVNPLESKYGKMVWVKANSLFGCICSADGSTHTESNELYRKVKHQYRPNLSLRQRPTAKSRHDQAALAASAEARGATHRARPRSPSRKKIRAFGATRLYTHSHELPALTALAQHISHSHSGIDEKRPTENFELLDLVWVNPNSFIFCFPPGGGPRSSANEREKIRKDALG